MATMSERLTPSGGLLPEHRTPPWPTHRRKAKHAARSRREAARERARARRLARSGKVPVR